MNLDILNAVNFPLGGVLDFAITANPMTAIGDSIASAAIDVLSYVVLAIATLALNAVLMLIVVYIFAGWIKAMLGVAFMPIAVVIASVDKGRMLASTMGFVVGAIATYAFSLAVGLIALAMISAGAGHIVSQHIVDTSAAGASGRVFTFAILILLLSVLIGLITMNAKSWGAEFFGSSSFDMSAKTPRKALKAKEPPKGDDQTTSEPTGGAEGPPSPAPIFGMPSVGGRSVGAASSAGGAPAYSRSEASAAHFRQSLSGAAGGGTGPRFLGDDSRTINVQAKEVSGREPKGTTVDLDGAANAGPKTSPAGSGSSSAVNGSPGSRSADFYRKAKEAAVDAADKRRSPGL